MSENEHVQPIGLSAQPPSTVLPIEPADVRHALAQAVASGDAAIERVSEFVARHPRNLDGWAALGSIVPHAMWRYSAARVGYHRGLDALRANGWRGSGYVRWSEVANHGFLRCLLLLQNAAAEIGETDEAERCAMFLLQLDPSGVPADVGVIRQP
jgi:hypothetical protein